MQALIGFELGVLLAVLLHLAWLHDMYRDQREAVEESPKTKRKRQMHPKSPKDCPHCKQDAIAGCEYRNVPARPWREVKSRRGRPKEHSSEGQACMNIACEYYRVTDEQIHALRRDGTRNKSEGVAQWECGGCGSKHTAWLGTVQYGLKTCSQEVVRALHLGMKGMSITDISEVLGYSEATIQRWMDRGGRHSERLHAQQVRQVRLGHVQLDELVTKVRSREKRVWLWTAIEVQTRLWIAWTIGGRRQVSAHHLIHQVMQKGVAEAVPTCTSDGLKHYFYALTAHYGNWVVEAGKRKPVWQVSGALLYGQLRKLRSGYRLRDIYTTVLCGTRNDMTEQLQALGMSGRIQTAYIERLNLTLRHTVGALRRRTMAIAHSIHTLRLRVALGAAYYNFCRPRESLRGENGERQTPAMAAGITKSVWTVGRCMLTPVY